MATLPDIDGRFADPSLATDLLGARTQYGLLEGKGDLLFLTTNSCPRGAFIMPDFSVTERFAIEG